MKFLLLLNSIRSEGVCGVMSQQPPGGRSIQEKDRELRQEEREEWGLLQRASAESRFTAARVTEGVATTR
ncbi:hypothetical protein GLYMA_04G152700v4 [Glycine max]|uniref:Uncharacterized protein n=2 Tax=Glycine subgen. Soja TaxID=1462606 RepID=K7KK47_SOYBN|nr:hypothetical protein JHK87_010147 [Glycine soja]KAG5049459.1 hypothetical protein JHK85_010562 [Glycine max]KAG5066552.1 hypothetical protein JHK86_010283 [Glycine max]KAH1111476.1 hypothetical protein GYH30_010032 [Glycine max]KHN12083.1 hypothetical protein glysoja_047302 [Glycine soja]